MELSWIQKHILLILIRQRSARLKDLQLPEIPANQFAYHLNGLVTEKVVVKISRGTYALTAKGEGLVGTFSTALDRQVENIKTVVMLYGKLDDRYLLFRWSRQPYLGYATPPHDRMPRGKLLTDGINSALDNKFGERREVVFRTSALIKIMHDGEIVSHLNALVYEVPVRSAHALPQAMRNGEVFLGRLDEVENIMDGVADFFAKVESVVAPFDTLWQY